MTKKVNDKSLILYTSLIFVVAIVMIIVSFFAQTHLDQSKIGVDDEEKVSLSNKAAQVSEENMQLVELNKSLKDANFAYHDQNELLKSDVERLTKENTTYKELVTISEKLLGGNKQAAKTLLQNINVEELTSEQTEYYNILQKKAE